ncbi:hypothetical protein ACHHYP_07746 [Achlya hypogyna]|uniref:Uncharacterized protein n=1 Tax=Achlya hypogyna TaxID=1202772 RepID=A0A1V9ZLJ6_ACHHY|nr:hypothetical protein ACHHYP_07746 [Achlya hypogyna]
MNLMDSYVTTDAPPYDALDTALLSEYFFSTDADLFPPPTSPPPPAAVALRKARDRRHRAKVKSELDTLRETVTVLTEKLATLQTSQDLELNVVGTSSWKQRARRQAVQLQRAVQENAKLREAVSGQLTMAQTFQRLAAKRPRHPELQEENSLHFYSLNHSACRATSCAALVARELTRLNSTLLRFDLVDAPRTCAHSTLDAVSGAVEIVHSRPVNATADKVVAALWQLLTGLSMPTHGFSCLEQFDADSAYVAYAAAPFHGRLALQRLHHEDHPVLVWRSVLEDDAHPFGADDILDNSSGWLLVVPISEFACHITIIVRSIAPPDAGDSVHSNIAHRIQAFQEARVTAIETVALAVS